MSQHKYIVYEERYTTWLRQYMTRCTKYEKSIYIRTLISDFYFVFLDLNIYIITLTESSS